MSLTVHPLRPITLIDHAVLETIGPPPNNLDEERILAATVTLGIDAVDLEVVPYIVTSAVHPYAGVAGFTVPPEADGAPWQVLVDLGDDSGGRISHTLWHELGHVQDALQRASERGVTPKDLYLADGEEYEAIKVRFGYRSEEYMKHYYELPPERAAEAVAVRYGHRRLTKEVTP